MSTLGEVMAGIPDPPPKNETTWTASNNGEREFVKWAGRVATDAAEGNRNNTVFKIAAEACGRGLQKDLALSLCREHGNGLSDAEVSRTVESAYSRERGANPPARTRTAAPAVAVEIKDAGLTFADLLAYNTKDDPEALFENGWLRRSGSCMEEGYSGIGKSSIAMQQAATWATGKDFFGIQPRRALRSIIIQAENDTADLAEEAQGVHLGAGLCPPDDMLRIFTRCDLCGEALARYAAALAERYKPDLVWLDNLNSYIGGDTNSPADCSKFLRLQLNPVSQRYGFAWIVLHHGNKPPKEDTGFSDIRAAYFGSGNNELTNWPRAKMLILPLKEGGFEFRCTKRGNRAGLLDEAGNRTDRIALQWSKSHICWERAESQALPVTNQGRIRELVENIIETSFEPGTAYKSKDLVAFVNKATGRHRSTILSQGTEANSVYNALRERTKHPQLPSTFIVQSPIQSKTVQLDA